MKGREALEIDWDKGVNARYDSVKYLSKMQKKAVKNGNIKREQGQIKKALRNASKVIEADFQVPHFCHSPMETPCAVAHYKADGSCELWAPVQDPQWTGRAVSEVLGIEEEKVTVNVTLLGGAFGRKSKPEFAVEAALISKQYGSPIKLLWTPGR